MNRRQMIAGSSATVAGVAATPFRVDVAAFGAKGDGLADDASAIQAALDHLGQRGGGTALLSPPSQHYRIGRGLTLPSNVVLEGVAPVRYPFHAGDKGACALVADFDDPWQWVVEPATRIRGNPVRYDRLVAETLPDGVTYNCGVRNLLITSKGKLPFGGIRMHGCPGSIVEGVSVDRVGCGLLVNYSFGGRYQAQLHTLYYGVAAWDDANANIFEVYCTQSAPWPQTIPAEYRLPFMVQLAGHFVDTLKLASDDHLARPCGLLCGSIASTSTSNAFDVVVERFVGGIFLYNAYGTDFRRCYMESQSGAMLCAVAASRSRFSMSALHAYLSGSGAVFDFGIDVSAKIFASGILHAATFGKAPVDDGASVLLLEAIDPAMAGAPIQRGVRYVGREGTWRPLAMRAGWRSSGTGEESVSARFDPWSHHVECRGTMTGGGAGPAGQLPVEWRPPSTRRFRVAGGEVTIDIAGIIRVAPDARDVSLDGVSFARW